MTIGDGQHDVIMAGAESGDSNYAETPTMGFICHGALRFIRANDRNEKLLIADGSRP